MGYTDAHGRPEIEPGLWFGTSPPQLRRSSTTGPVPTAEPPRSEGGTSQGSNESAGDAAAEPSTGTPGSASTRLRRRRRPNAADQGPTAGSAGLTEPG